MNRNTLLRVLRVSFVLLVLGFLGISAVMTARNHETISYYENRYLAAMPEPDRETVLSGLYFHNVDTSLQDHSFLREPLLKVSTFLDLQVYRRPVVNEICHRDDALLLWTPYYDLDENHVRELAEASAEKIAAHARAAEAVGARFYFVVVPQQNYLFADRLPDYAYDIYGLSRLKADCLYDALDRMDVRYIDIGPVLEALHDPERYGSPTDNHYSMYGAYVTCREILSAIEADTGWALPVLEEEDYLVTELPNPYMGSRLRKLLGMWPSSEHAAVMVPREEIPFERLNYAPWMAEGEPALVEPAVYLLPETDDEPVDFGLYMGGDWAFSELRTNRPELPDILLYGDSFTNPAECLLYTSFNSLCSLDLRHYDLMDLDEYITRYKPDVVVCIRDYDSLLSVTGNGQ